MKLTLALIRLCAWASAAGQGMLVPPVSAGTDPATFDRDPAHAAAIVAQLPRGAPPASDPPQSPASNRSALVAACDHLAAAPADPSRPPDVPGVAPAAIDSRAAILACRAAVSAFDAAGEGSERPRMVFQLGRALEAAKLYADARASYEEAAAANYPAAMNGVGRLYDGGLGVPQDHVAARGWYERAAAAGHGAAMHNLGLLYENGQGVAQDYGAAWDWYEQGAAVGDADSMVKLGTFYMVGRGVAQDYRLARQWYEKAASAGNPSGMTGVGILYESGYGVGQSYATARSWFEKAAALGDALAMRNLGILYHHGDRAWHRTTRQRRSGSRRVRRPAIRGPCTALA